ncbi:MAG TPA: FMN-binding negative transcriptional regulator [Polyangiaceae bacterium]|nr:FMN-binding negative transcriptional regulator [Polyangiaceae bacterium]
MYVPDAFRQDDRECLFGLAKAYPFATLFTYDEGEPRVSHLPLCVDLPRGVIRGHLARQNPQYEALASGTHVLAIFHGPHGYVSPSVYVEHPSVPTWNYVVVHAYGRARIVDEDGLRSILEETVARFDESDWRLDTGEEFLRPMLEAIAGFEITVERLEGKWKLSQNRSPQEQARVAAWLERGDDSSRALAAFMKPRR